MKKIFALMLFFCLLLSMYGCFAEEVSLCYAELVDQDGFTLAINKMARCCFAGEYTCAAYTEGLQITIPDEYNGVPVTRLGGYYGRGLPIPFYIDVDMRLTESDPYPDGHPAIYYEGALPIGCKTEDLLFNLQIGKNLETIEFVEMDNYRPFYNAAGEVIYYHPVVYVTCSEENPYFYAEDGKLYYKENNALVTEFAYAESEKNEENNGNYLSNSIISQPVCL